MTGGPAMASKPVSLMISVDSVNFTEKGEDVYLGAGRVYLSDDPFVRRHPGYFAPLVIALDGQPDLDTAEVAVQVTGGAAESGHGTMALPVRVRRSRSAPDYFGVVGG
jgi:hypothetical protein